MWAISLLTIMFLLPLLSAAPLDIKADNDGMHSHDENVTRVGKFFGNNRFDMGDMNISGSVAGDVVSIGHKVKIDVHAHTHDHHHHEADTVIECKEGIRELFKSIDSNKDGVMDAMELLRVCHQNNIQITESLAVRILTLPDKTVGFNMAKFCELLKDCQSKTSAGFIYFLLQLFDKVEEKREFSVEEKREFSPPRPQPKACSCSDLMSKSGKYGNCKKGTSKFAWCYVNKPSSCSDIIASNDYPGEGLSFEACKDLQGDDELRLYEHVEEAGRSVTIYGPTNLQLHNFDDLASSVHAVKGNWELYVHSDYSGNRMVVEEGQKINTDRNDVYSSARPICKYYDDRSTALLKVYRDVSSQGDKKEFSNEKGDLGDDSDKISSVHVVKGDWELYEHINYHGVREVVREGDQIDIQHNDFHSSLRPICETYTYSTKCTPVRFEILEDPVSQFKGTKIIGSASGFSCNDPSTQTLTLNNVNSVTKSISLSASKSLGTDWSFGASATVTGSVGFLGSGTEVSATVSYSAGGSFSITHQTIESVTKGDSKLVGSSTTYQTPGAAIAFGTVDIRETDSSEVPVKIHLNCTADGKNFKLEEKLSTMKLTSQTFQSADFFAFVKKIDNAEDCNKNGFISKTDKCIRDVKDRYFNVFGEKEQMRKDFNDCFA